MHRTHATVVGLLFFTLIYLLFHRFPILKLQSFKKGVLKGTTFHLPVAASIYHMGVLVGKRTHKQPGKQLDFFVVVTYNIYIIYVGSHPKVLCQNNPMWYHWEHWTLSSAWNDQHNPPFSSSFTHPPIPTKRYCEIPTMRRFCLN